MQHAERSAPWWQVFIDAIDKLPASQQAGGLAKLALMLAKRGERHSAADIALRAWRLDLEAGGAAKDQTVRRAMCAVTPRYHVQISTDTQRIMAWQASLGDVVRPGTLALEIGSGSGILAMLAARAGAHVVSCEKNPVLAAIAEMTVRQNGLNDCIRIVNRAGADLRVPEDITRPADLLLLDLFANRLFDFSPFATIRSVNHLLSSNVIAVPSRVSLKAALADFRLWHRTVPGTVAGFDLAALNYLSSAGVGLDAADPDFCIRSTAQTIVSATLPRDLPGPIGVSEPTLISQGGRVNGAVLWLRLELAQGHVLEAQPGLAPRGFYARPYFFAFPEPLETRPGEPCSIRIRWEEKSLAVEHTAEQ